MHIAQWPWQLCLDKQFAFLYNGPKKIQILCIWTWSSQGTSFSPWVTGEYLLFLHEHQQDHYFLKKSFVGINNLLLCLMAQKAPKKWHILCIFELDPPREHPIHLESSWTHWVGTICYFKTSFSAWSITKSSELDRFSLITGMGW